jgi:ribosomal protein S14
VSEQLALLEPAPPRLTERQRAVHDALVKAGQDGLDADQAGAIAHTLKDGRWAHSKDERCQFCGKDGQAILRRLGELGLARYRRANRARSIPGAWLATNAEPQPNPETPPDGTRNSDGTVPYNVVPY